MTKQHSKVRMRDINFVTKTVTHIWQEQPLESNPYLTQTSRCHGYDVMSLAQKRSFVDMLYLLFRGELPSIEQSQLLETLMVAFINPGPRHPATRAAMNAGVGKTNATHILPIALSILGGAHLGGTEVEEAMLFLKRHSRNDPARLAKDLVRDTEQKEGDIHIAPGFGSRFGGIDPMPGKVAVLLNDMPGSGKALNWGASFVQNLEFHKMGWLTTGVAAAVFCDLGFLPLAGAGLFQLICAPGLLAHGLELASPYKSIAAMPFLTGEHYVIEQEARTPKG